MNRTPEAASVQELNVRDNEQSSWNSNIEEETSSDLPRIISQEGFLPSSKKSKPNSTSSLCPTSSYVTSNAEKQHHPFSGKYTNLLSESNSCVLFATDEWFARAENLIKDSEPVFIPDLYCPEGKVMDGWETRRKRTEGHDWCVIATKSKCQAKQNKINDIVGIEIDTAFFTGNQAPRISIQVANCFPENYNQNKSYDDNEDEAKHMYTWMPNAITRLVNGGGIQGTGQSPKQIQKASEACNQFEWKEILPMTPLRPGYEESRMHYFPIDEKVRNDVKGFTHVRVNYYPDGGVARLRLWGTMHSQEERKIVEEDVDDFMIETEKDNAPPSSEPYPYPELSLSSNGGVGLSCSNKHYGVPENLIQPTYGKDMGDGWETARHPNRPPVLIKDPKTNLIDNPLMDWAILKLGMGGSTVNEGIHRVIIDTKHFKGNFPESVMVEGFDANAQNLSDDDIVCIANSEVENNCTNRIEWFPLVNRAKMGADCEHVFDRKEGQLMNWERAVTHIRVSIFPDGGISRVRVYGQPAANSFILG